MNNSNQEIKKDIRSKKIELESLRFKLEALEKELQFEKHKLEFLERPLKKKSDFLKEKLKIVSAVMNIKTHVHNLFVTKQFNVKTTSLFLASERTMLSDLFVGNRFITYFYNDLTQEAGFFSNDRINKYGDVCFNMNKAYEIGYMNITDEEKLKLLDNMFNYFLEIESESMAKWKAEWMFADQTPQVSSTSSVASAKKQKQ
jgi:hypothetical protein